jgi:arsenate reductase
VADLEGRGFELVKHDLIKEPPSRELLGKLIDEYGVEAMLNPRSPSYKERDLGSKKLSKAEAIKLMLEDTNLIKRPVVLGGKTVVLGFKPDEYDKLK